MKKIGWRIIILGNILMEKKELKEAEEQLKKADQLKPNTPEILFSLGET